MSGSKVQRGRGERFDIQIALKSKNSMNSVLHAEEIRLKLFKSHIKMNNYVRNTRRPACYVKLICNKISNRFSFV